MENKVIKASEKGLLVLDYLKANAEGAFGAVIAEAKGIDTRGIHGVINPLVKNGLVGKQGEVAYVGLDKDGKEVDKKGTLYFITQAGVDHKNPVDAE